MDAVKFIKERDRMCRFYHHAGDCYQCPAKDCECSALEGMVDDDNIVTIVEEWSAAHPRKTRQSVFLEQYPEADIDEQGYLKLCPRRISANCRSGEGLCTKRMCSSCLSEFWMQEVE
jgi:hypothetical protein